MKKSKIEKHLFDEADSLISDVPSFESINKRVDWDDIASKTSRQKRIHWGAIAATACACSLIVGVTLGLTIHYNTKPPTHYGQGEDSPVVFGHFKIDKWSCLNEQWDFSTSSLIVQKEKAVKAFGNVNIYDKDGTFACSISFYGSPFAYFDFTDFSPRIAEYSGKGLYSGENYPVSVAFSRASERPKSLQVSYGGSNSTSIGNVFYKFVD